MMRRRAGLMFEEAGGAAPAALGSSSAGASVVARDLTHRYDSREGQLTVLDGVSLTITPGEHVAVMGVSGAGKSTLLSLIGGLEHPQQGSLHVDGLDLASLSGDGLAAYRRETVGFVFQHFGLLEALTAVENVELACTLSGMSSKARAERAADLLAAVGMSHRALHQPLQLSGGERQRVAIARALANRPRLVLADEPTGNLDEVSAAVVMDLLADLPVRLDCTLVVVTHSRPVAERADRVVHLEPPVSPAVPS